MNPIYEAAVEIRDFLDEQGWRYCFIGGLVASRWGEPRATQDVDLSLLAGFDDREEEFVDKLHARFRSKTSSEFALKYRIVNLLSTGGIGIDVALAALPFEEAMIRNATAYEFLPDVRLSTCGVEDFLVTKVFADRDRDWGDVRAVLMRQQKIDLQSVYWRLSELLELKGDDAPLKRLQQLVKEIH